MTEDPSKYEGLSEKDKAMMQVGADQGSEQTENQKADPAIGRIPSDSDTFKSYFDNYPTHMVGRITFEELAKSNRNGTFLYELRGTEPRTVHILWVYNRSDQRPDPIPAQTWQELKANPELIEAVNQSILEAYREVLHLYEWQQAPYGFIVDGSKNFGMEAGNVEGVRVAYDEIQPLIEALRNDNSDQLREQRQHVAASMAHELTHNERADGLGSSVKAELASHVAQYLFDPKTNSIFSGQLDRSLVRIGENRQQVGEKRPLSLYDTAQSASLILVAGRLTEYSPVFAQAINEDADPNKLPTLRRLSDFIGEEELQRLRTELIPEIMKTDNDQLIDLVRATEERFGIAQSILEIR